MTGRSPPAEGDPQDGLNQERIIRAAIALMTPRAYPS